MDDVNTDDSDFEEDPYPRPGAPGDAAGALADAGDGDALVLHIDGFEGPLDVLLMLARAQKVDLTQISILELVEQYLAFIAEARRMKLEIAADYLVMAAWLAYLKSRLLLPREEDDEEPSAEEMALRLQLRLQRLEAMREAGARLMARNRLGRDMFARGAPEGVVIDRHGRYDITLYELLKAYAYQQSKQAAGPIHIARRPVYALEEALERLSGLIGEIFSWSDLVQFLPRELSDPRLRRSAVASMFAASLELARQGVADIRQMETYGPLYVRRKEDEA